MGLKEQDKYEHVSGKEVALLPGGEASLSVAAKWQNSNKHKRAHTYIQFPETPEEAEEAWQETRATAKISELVCCLWAASACACAWAWSWSCACVCLVSRFSLGDSLKCSAR